MQGGQRTHRPVTLFLGLTTFFALIYGVNNALTSFLLLVPGAHLVHIPSGFKLLLVLICGWTAALGIGLVSFVAGAFFSFEGLYLLSFELALVNAAAPLLTRRFFVDHFSLDATLVNLNWHRLLGVSLLYAALNSCMNQLVIYYNQVSTSLLDGLLVMWLGDITGILIVLMVCQSLARRLAPRLARPLIP